MASNVVKSPFVRCVVARHYATAQACPAASKKEATLSTTTLPNKIFVAALDNGSPITRITIAFKGGSRYEPVTEPGLAHVLRSAAGLTTKDASAFGITRNLQQIGASLTATVDRELVSYTLEVSRDNAQSAIKYLTSVAVRPEFRPWELSDNSPRLNYDIVALPPQVRAVDLLHKAAFRRGLGNSLFISPRRIGKVSTESLQHFVASNFTASRCAIAVVGGSQDSALAIAQSLGVADAGKEDAASRYGGGELRKEIGGDLAHVALAVQGTKTGAPGSLALAIAAKALGNGPAVKWGKDNSPLASAIGNIGPFAAAGFNLSYTDSGLFGVLLSVHKDEADKAVKAAVGLLKKSNLSAAAIKAGKNALKVQILNEAELGTNLAEQLAAQGLYNGSAKTPKELASEVDKVTDSDVANALSSINKGQLSLGAVGNLITVPYLDEL